MNMEPTPTKQSVVPIETLRAAHQVLAEFRYTPPKVRRGYANQTLYVNVGDNTIASKPVDEKMKQTFIGGRGFGLWLLWNAVRNNTRWNDPENEVILSSGPIGGTTVYPGAGKSIAVSLSPLTGTVVDSNVGGHFGPLLKFAGWDAIEIQGQATEEVIVFVDGNQGLVQILPHRSRPTIATSCPSRLWSCLRTHLRKGRASPPSLPARVRSIP